jgi:hypothetical protein
MILEYDALFQKPFVAMVTSLVQLFRQEKGSSLQLDLLLAYELLPSTPTMKTGDIFLCLK